LRKISGAKAPAMAMIEPTERSMPPVAMTSVMPVATITMVQTCVRFTLSVCRVAKLRVKIRLKTMSSRSAISVPYRVRNPKSCTPCSRRAGVAREEIASVIAAAPRLFPHGRGP
jgi:hypothetical protein